METKVRCSVMSDVTYPWDLLPLQCDNWIAGTVPMGDCRPGKPASGSICNTKKMVRWCSKEKLTEIKGDRKDKTGGSFPTYG